MNKLVKRVFAQVVGKPFLRALVFPLFVVLLLISMADATVDWQGSRKQISQLSPWTKTAIFTALFTVWSVSAGRALRAVWQQRAVGFLVRQPISDWEWTAQLVPSLCIALAPPAAAWWLVSYDAEPVGHYLGFVGLALPIVLGASLRGIISLAVVCASAVILALLMFAYGHYPAVAYLGMLLTPFAAQRAAALVRRQGTFEKRGGGRGLSSSSVIGALVLRDLRCIVRTRGATFIEMLALCVFVALMMFACRVNGAVAGRDALLIACVLFLIATVTTYNSLEIAKTRLGREMMRPAWPVSYAERGGALAALVAVLMGPAALLLAVIGGTMGVLNLGVFVLFVFTTIVLTAALFARALRRASSAVGLFINLIVFHGVLLFVVPEWGYLLAALGILVVSSSLLESGLRRFARDIQMTGPHVPA